MSVDDFLSVLALLLKKKKKTKTTNYQSLNVMDRSICVPTSETAAVTSNGQDSLLFHISRHVHVTDN